MLKDEKGNVIKIKNYNVMFLINKKLYLEFCTLDCLMKLYQYVLKHGF